MSVMDAFDTLVNALSFAEEMGFFTEKESKELDRAVDVLYDVIRKM